MNPAATPVTDTERQAIRDGHAAGNSANAIARQLGRGRSTVTMHARRMGLTWDSTRTAAASQAKQATNRERRASAIARLYDQADRQMNRLDQQTYKLIGMDKDGYARTNTIDQDAIPAADVRALHSTVVNMLNTAARLEQIDVATTGSTEVTGFLNGLADSLANYGSLAHTKTAVVLDD